MFRLVLLILLLTGAVKAAKFDINRLKTFHKSEKKCIFMSLVGLLSFFIACDICSTSSSRTGRIREQR